MKVYRFIYCLVLIVLMSSCHFANAFSEEGRAYNSAEELFKRGDEYKGISIMIESLIKHPNYEDGITFININYPIYLQNVVDRVSRVTPESSSSDLVEAAKDYSNLLSVLDRSLNLKPITKSKLLIDFPDIDEVATKVTQLYYDGALAIRGESIYNYKRRAQLLQEGCKFDRNYLDIVDRYEECKAKGVMVLEFVTEQKFSHSSHPAQKVESRVKSNVSNHIDRLEYCKLVDSNSSPTTSLTPNVRVEGKVENISFIPHKKESSFEELEWKKEIPLPGGKKWYYRLNSDEEFNQFFEEMERGFSIDRNKKVKNHYYQYSVTIDQLIEILNLFSFSHEKLEIIKLSSSSIIDMENSYKVVELFSFDHDKKRAEKLLNQEYRKAIGDKAFAKFIMEFKSISSREKRSKRLQKFGFNHFLKAHQMVKILKRVRSFDEKKDCIKILFRSVSDKENRHRVLKHFSYHQRGKVLEIMKATNNPESVEIVKYFKHRYKKRFEGRISINYKVVDIKSGEILKIINRDSKVEDMVSWIGYSGRVPEGVKSESEKSNISRSEMEGKLVDDVSRKISRDLISFLK